jgi:predicted esterase
MSNFTGQHLVGLTDVYLTPPKGLKTDPGIGIEVFAATPGDQKPPVLIFSHGIGTSPVQYRPLLGELASHGYTVLSLHHPSIVEDLPAMTREEESAKVEKLALVMANNIQYVIDEFRNGTLKGIVGDENKILLGGHSLGGAASIMVARTDHAITGCVNLDGFLHGKRKTDGLKPPLLMITGDYKSEVEKMAHAPEEEARDYARYMSQSLDEYDTLHQNSPHSTKILIERGIHTDFTDVPFREYLAGKKTLDVAMRVHTIVSQEILKFMNQCSFLAKRAL